MANNKDNQNRQKPDSNANSQPMPDEFSNEANHKGAVDLGTDGTKATASQQQGQGAWGAKDKDNRTGSRSGSGGGGQGAQNKTGKED
ncbi:MULTISPECIES: hypothetical protein [Pontibacter]|uniref:Uncharacterized protein n=1 Tax=Pontibacter lucknowensis TaxID=1077936 RepID=A0A1N6T7Q8_9BACT|nr:MULTISPECIES: hypothetical protein [Pontibacter]EJF09114.1 hypothetical protein O71_16931 [Pontibacter sp. BAB1700]SIQ49257.1 hypothetical protein SAMN05421545_0160 [Pontibacter lucknowensis]